MTEPSPLDVSTRMDWVVSYPKSGNTWVRMLISAYAAQTPTAYASAMDEGSYFFGCVSPVPVANLTLGQQVQLRPAALFHLAARNAGLPVLVKSHQMNGTFMGVPMFSPQWVRKVIYVVRDPRDVAPSFAHHTDTDLTDMVERMGDRESRQESDVRGLTQLGSWSDHVGSWLDSRAFEVLVVKYERLQDDTAAVLEKVLGHLGWFDEIEDRKVAEAVQACRFDKLKDTEDRVGFPEKPEGSSRFFRKGKAGGWQEEVPVDLVSKLQDDHGDMMDRLGYQQAVVT